MINNKKIDEILKGLNDSALHRAEQYLNGKKVRSVKCFDDDTDLEFEAFIAETPQKILMPTLSVGDSGEVTDIHCQCNNNTGLCIHEIALLLAAQFMIKADGPDYHMARRIQTCKVLEGLFPQ